MDDLIRAGDTGTLIGRRAFQWELLSGIFPHSPYDLDLVEISFVAKYPTCSQLMARNVSGMGY